MLIQSENLSEGIIDLKLIVSDIETISIDEVNEAYERVIKRDVRYRFVIAIASLK